MQPLNRTLRNTCGSGSKRGSDQVNRSGEALKKGRTVRATVRCRPAGEGSRLGSKAKT